MSKSPLENLPDLIGWKNENEKIKGRGKPRICECGAVVVSKILMECPICGGLLPKIELNPKKKPTSSSQLEINNKESEPDNEIHKKSEIENE